MLDVNGQSSAPYEITLLTYVPYEAYREVAFRYGRCLSKANSSLMCLIIAFSDFVS